MNRHFKPAPNTRYAQTVLVLQGGGALGSYQAGAYEAMHATAVEPDWISGISIGSINAAIIAGNDPDKRIPRLRSFWRRITQDWPPAALIPQIEAVQQFAGGMSAMHNLAFGAPGFFRNRPTSFSLPFSWLPSWSLSFYDTAPLRDLLLEHADFDRINSGSVRLSLGAVNVRTGNFRYFDTASDVITPEHVMASGALPPGFPPVEIDGEYYWDGGLVSNTPLAHVLDHSDEASTLIIQVDLFSAVGLLPETIAAVEERRKDIVYSSRTRLNTDRFHELHRLRSAISRLADSLPDAKRREPELAGLAKLGTDRVYAILHLIYRPDHALGSWKDFEFSRRSMQAHWSTGHADAFEALQSRSWREPPSQEDAIAVHDINREMHA